MTTLVLNYSTNLLESLFASLKTTLAKVMIGWQMARQMQANSHLAPLLKHEYPHLTVLQIQDQLNRKTKEMYEVKNENT